MSNSKSRFRTIGYLLHPKISLGPHARVADIATGTGVILTDLAESHPITCQFDGFDISDAQFPPAAKLPSNVKLHIADAKQSLPSEHHEKFDVVFIRYLNAAMRPQDWQIVTRNAYDLLKPGGWLQWVEGDWSQAAHWNRLDPLPESNGAIQELGELIGSVKDMFRYFTLELADIFRNVGLKDIIHEVTSSDRIPETRSVWAHITIGPLTGMLMHTQSAKEDGKPPEYCLKLRNDVMEEANAGIIYPRFDIHTFLGRKA
jgi:ubiquinone/menaquinone biosynthesis C-methylase UbiE